MTADGPVEADAERAVRAASKIAEAAVSKAVQAAAMAGLEYMPPPDMQLDTPRVTKVSLYIFCLACHGKTICY